jgi:predicted RNA binding protein YcfA (HicA-like mRNA interferase family)
MNSREIIKMIEKAGWKHVRTSGSHMHFRHPQKPGTTTVPHPKKDVPVGTLKSIEDQAGVKLRRR